MLASEICDGRGWMGYARLWDATIGCTGRAPHMRSLDFSAGGNALASVSGNAVYPPQTVATAPSR